MSVEALDPAGSAEALGPARFREVLGQYPTGVAVVTGLSRDGEPLGMTVGSFTSVSLSPPLVAFLPAKESSSWRALRGAGSGFCVNVLSASQEDVCRQIAVRKSDKFDGIDWTRTASGNPVIKGCVAYIDCDTEAIQDAGDHYIVIGRVRELDAVASGYPLLFYRSGYGSFTPRSLAAGDVDLLGVLKLVDLARPQMEALSQHFDTEVTAIALVGGELVLTAAAGRAQIAVTPTRVGQRIPFVPPLGSLFAAYGGAETADRWLRHLDVPAAGERVLERVRRRGYAIAVGHERCARLELLSARLNAGDPEVPLPAVTEAIRSVSFSYNQDGLEERDGLELRSMSAPVFRDGGGIAFTLTIWGPPGMVSRPTVAEYESRLLEAARRATASICVS
jgi:flavin reductase (DIM6/NTAB) family NADH-FMN oxidoreductase RutF/DNA-binding IclR family transcriptional regulator